MEYASKGSLRENLDSVAQLKWKDKLVILLCIISDLEAIHSKKIIHRDLHSGNILQDHLHSAYIVDLGLSISSNTALKAKSGGIYGVWPYISPEVLERGQYTTRSDIYSFGIIMWEILHGKPVHYDENFGPQLQIEICRNDKRPIIIKNTPQCYIDLMKECWNKEPEKRPSAAKISKIFIEWQTNEKILLELLESEKIPNIVSMHEKQYNKMDYISKFIHNTTSFYQDNEINNLIIKD